MTSPKLDYRLAFERRPSTAGESPPGDGYGNFLDDFQMEFEVFAAIRPLRGGEGVIAGRLQGSETVIITVRATLAVNGVSTDWRARDVRSGRIYNIRSIPPQERAGFIEMLAESGVAT